ncbi:uncharacterized protein LOC107615776 [Arachis ipaensis]|uniref:uncharacterized protein LOC107615776 n=1 Tax=Arachis ipaensis TaxID=130454 RepID=UPI0007AF054F|nr:uncharacterized protein LOC107615776 [Arachis ipaensis]
MSATLFIKNSNDNFILVKVYIDDIVFGSGDESLCAEFTSLMTSEFDMSLMGELTFFLGLQINQIKDGIFVHQEKYAKELINKFGVKLVKPMSTSMHPSTKLDKDENAKDVNETRSDIIFSVELLSRFQSQPKESHLSAVKRIIRYILGPTNYGLWYPKSDFFSLIGYSDADFAGDRVDRRSTSGIYCTIGNALNM